jgi:type IX secretion system substrate protein
MKKLFFVLSLLITVYQVNAQIPSSCTVPPVLQYNYDADVKHLALQRIFNQNSNYKDSIDVANSYQDTIWQGLAAIFNLTSVLERDSVFDKYCIHQEVSNSVYHSIYVAVDTTYSWTQQWQNLNTTTGITSLDSLLSLYGFTITNFSTFGSNYATLTTVQNINVLPLCASIEAFSGVVYSEPNPSGGDGNEIVYTQIGNDRFYNFTVGYGDCYSGCTSNHIYKFKVDNNCSVDFLGVVDNITPSDVIPAPINCNITTGIKYETLTTNFNVYPNPTNGIFTIQTKGNLTIYNLLGEKIFFQNLVSEKNEINLSGQSKGIYFLQIDSENKCSTQKIIIQ